MPAPAERISLVQDVAELLSSLADVPRQDEDELVELRPARAAAVLDQLELAAHRVGLLHRPQVDGQGKPTRRTVTSSLVPPSLPPPGVLT